MPETKYVDSNGASIAYQVVGDGPRDFVYVPTWISQIEHLWEEPMVARFFERLSTFARLILFDRRGSGLSDPILGPPTIEEQMEDVTAVLDAVGSERADVFAQVEGAAMAALFAATHPERTGSLVLYAPVPRTQSAPGYGWPGTPEERAARVDAVMASWGTGERMEQFAPSEAGNERLRRWWAKLERLSASPGTARTFIEFVGELDVRCVLPNIHVPTLVMHRRDDQLIDIRHSRYVAEHIPGARFVELPGSDNLIVAGDVEAVLGEVEEFLTGRRGATDAERVLSTVLFTDIVDSTGHAATLGDRRWRDVLDSHYELVGRAIERHRGRQVKTVGDGVLATFDGPARAVQCAVAIRDAIRQVGLTIRAGLHTGEIEQRGNDVAGIAVHIAQRVQGVARPGEVLVSRTVVDLVGGSGLQFEDRAEHALKGVPDPWRLFSVLD
jgi:class 3 adenylate cyclase